MFEGNKEVLLENYPIPITIEENYLIIDQMKKCICKIIKNNGEKGSGFFCCIPFKSSKLPVLITNYHVINKDNINNNSIINLTINDDKDIKVIKIGNNRKIYLNEDYDTTIIEIIPSIDKINYCLDIEDKILIENSENLYKKESIYIMHYPKSQKVCVSYGILKDIQDYDIFHYCSTENGSSGSPILSLSSKRIIGIHKEGLNKFNYNKGTFLKYPIIEFINSFLYQNNNNVIINNSVKKSKEKSTDEKYKEVGTIAKYKENNNSNNYINNSISDNNISNKNSPNTNLFYKNTVIKKTNKIQSLINPEEYYFPPNKTNITDIRSYFKYPPLIGLENIGAYCFMNSTLQCFCNIEKFVNFFKYTKQVFKIYAEDKSKLSSSFKLLIERLWPNNYDDPKLKKYYAPYEFKKKYLQ